MWVFLLLILIFHDWSAYLQDNTLLIQITLINIGCSGSLEVTSRRKEHVVAILVDMAERLNSNFNLFLA
jgi:hypothetical protein